MRILVLGTWLGLLAASSAGADGPKAIHAKSPSGKGGYRVESAVKIGGGDAADNAQFYEKMGRTDVDADGQGRIYVLDSGGPRVQIFDAQGKFMRSIGKSGEGPGEMKMPSQIAVSRDAKLAVFDMGLQRISIFDAQGKLLRDQLVQGPVRDMMWDAQGNLVVASGGRAGDALEAFDAAGKVVWSQHATEAAVPAGGRRIFVEVGNETVAPRLALASNGDMYRGSESEYGLSRIARGTVTQTWSREYERQERPPMPQPRDGEEGGGQVVMIRRTEGGGGAAAGATTTVTSGNGSQSSPDQLVARRYSEDAAEVRRRHARRAGLARRPRLGRHVDERR
jgi:YD repeat-containing protein